MITSCSNLNCCIARLAVEEMTKKEVEMERHRCWVILTRMAEVISMSHYDGVLCHSTCRRGRCWELLNWLDRDFLRCLMELTLFYLRAISVRALYAKRQSTSPQPFQCVQDHCWVIDKNVVGQGRCDDWESLLQILNRLSGVKQQARATEYHILELFPLEPISAFCTPSWILNFTFIEKQKGVCQYSDIHGLL